MKKKSFLSGIKPWALSLLTAIFALILLFILSGLLSDVAKLGNTGELLAYIGYDIAIVTACFFICRKTPASFWYVPIICNAMGIISAIVEPNFWITNMWIVICSGWVLSLTSAIVGAAYGRRNISQKHKMSIS